MIFTRRLMASGVKGVPRSLVNSAGEELIIPKELWTAIEERQTSRKIADPWEDILADVGVWAMLAIKPDDVVQAADKDGKAQWRVKSAFLLGKVLGIAADRINASHSQRLRDVMRSLGWTGPIPIRFESGPSKGYCKPVA